MQVTNFNFGKVYFQGFEKRINFIFSRVLPAHIYAALHGQAFLAHGTLQKGGIYRVHATRITQKTSAPCGVQLADFSFGLFGLQLFQPLLCLAAITELWPLSIA